MGLQMAAADEKTSITKDFSMSHCTYRVTKIISGGQSGADQAALDVAIEKGIPHGGWIPKGRLTDAVPMKEAINLIWSWIDENQVEVLNVAGARASKDAKIYPKTRAILEALL
jgi:hypothetical protein